MTLSAALKHYHAGDTATLKLYRAGAEVEVQITFDEKQPDTAEADQTPEEQQPADPWQTYPGSGNGGVH